MTRIMKERWDANKDKLRDALAERTDLNHCNYEDLVNLTFEVIYNTDANETGYQVLNLNNITVVDDGDYQGTVVFLIPFDTYQPSEHEYIMTYIGYGSCSGCDVLQAVQSCGDYGKKKATEDQLDGFMDICRELICNAIKPYNFGWREDENWNPAEF